MPASAAEGADLERLWSSEIRHLHRQFTQGNALAEAKGEVAPGTPGSSAAPTTPAASPKALAPRCPAAGPLACCACPAERAQGPQEAWTASDGEWSALSPPDSPPGIAGSLPVMTGGAGEKADAASDAPTESVGTGKAEPVELWPGINGAGRLLPENLDFWELTRGQQPRRVPNVENRGVTPMQLRALLTFLKKRCSETGAIRGWYDPKTGAQLHYKTFNFQHLLFWIIKPLTQRLNCSFVEATASESAPSAGTPQSRAGAGRAAARPKWFVGHWWGESVLDFTKRIMKHAGTSEESYWVCPLSTCLHECAGLAVADVQDKTGVVALHSLTTLKVYLSGCSGLNALDELERGLSAFQSLTLLELNLASCWELEGVEELGKSLAKLRFLRSLRLNLSDCSGLRSVAPIGRGFAQLPSLERVDLDFSCCSSLTSVDEVGVNLGKLQALTFLRMNFTGCSRLQDVGGIGRGFRSLKRLTALDLNFSGCSELAHVDELGRSVVMLGALASLEVNFFGCSSLTSVDDLGRGLALMQSLTALKVELFGCSSLKTVDELQRGIEVLQGRKALSRLEVNIAGCPGLFSQPAFRQ